MKKKKTLRQKFLEAAKAKPRKKTVGQKAEIEAGADSKALWLQLLEIHFDELKSLRKELSGDGDDSIGRELLELYQETGIDALTLQEMEASEVEKYLRAAIRKRKAQARQWVYFDKSDAWCDRSKLSRHAKDDKKPHVERVSRGQYRVWESHKNEYLRR